VKIIGTLLQVGELVETQDGLVGLGLVVLEQDLDLVAVDAAGGVGLVDGELDAPHLFRPDHGAGAGQRQNGTETDGVGVGGRHRERDRDDTGTEQMAHGGSLDVLPGRLMRAVGGGQGRTVAITRRSD